MNFIPILDFASVLVFALSGALVASRQQLDLIGFAFIACLTAVGGGTIRDVYSIVTRYFGSPNPLTLFWQWPHLLWSFSQPTV